jgi:hypothetical protein
LHNIAQRQLQRSWSVRVNNRDGGCLGSSPLAASARLCKAWHLLRSGRWKRSIHVPVYICLCLCPCPCLSESSGSKSPLFCQRASYHEAGSRGCFGRVFYRGPSSPLSASPFGFFPASRSFLCIALSSPSPGSKSYIPDAKAGDASCPNRQSSVFPPCSLPSNHQHNALGLVAFPSPSPSLTLHPPPLPTPTPPARRPQDARSPSPAP